MASTQRRNYSTLEALLNKPEQFDFFQAVFLLEKYLAHEIVPHHLSDNTASFATSSLHFKASSILAFTPHAINEIKILNKKSNEKSQKIIQLTINNFCLTGATGVLPNHYTELLLQRIQAKDYALRDFLDIFNHQFISLLYESWKKYHFLSNATIEEKTRNPNKISYILLNLLGLGNKTLTERHLFNDQLLIYYSGLLIRRPVSAINLQRLLSDYFQLPIITLPFQGEELILSIEDRSKLITKFSHKNSYNVLGKNFIIGCRLWNQQNHFRVFIANLSYQKFKEFLPGQANLIKIQQLIRYTISIELKFDIQLCLQASDVPFCQIQRKNTVNLGWNSWLKTKMFTKDAGDLILREVASTKTVGLHTLH